MGVDRLGSRPSSGHQSWNFATVIHSGLHNSTIGTSRRDVSMREPGVTAPSRDAAMQQNGGLAASFRVAARLP